MRGPVAWWRDPWRPPRILLGATAVYLVWSLVPVLIAVLFSFNDSPVPNVWRGFTLKWYAALAADNEMLSGLWLSLKIALMTACGSVIRNESERFAEDRALRKRIVELETQLAAAGKAGSGAA